MPATKIFSLAVPTHSPNSLGCCSSQQTHGHKGCVWPSGLGTPNADCPMGCTAGCETDEDDGLTDDEDDFGSAPRDRYREAVRAAETALDTHDGTVLRAALEARLRTAEARRTRAFTGTRG